MNRRAAIRLGGLTAFGLSLADALQAEARAGDQPAASITRPSRPASSCILLYMHGGPSHLDTFDPKPDAPAEIRGEFGTIATAVPGVRVCEHLPQTARALARAAVVRSVHHPFSNHNPATYIALSGRAPGEGRGRAAQAGDFPGVGPVSAHLRPSTACVPSLVHLPELANDGPPAPGQFGGFLGQAANPFLLNDDPNVARFDVPELRLPASLVGSRIDDRRALLQAVDAQARAWEASASARAFGPYYERAFALLTSPAAKAAFAIGREDPRTRDRYGRNKYGQSVLLARRLVEHGVRFVTVNMGAFTLDGWDTHSKNFEQLKTRLCPPTDHYLPALLDDLAERSLLDCTLVVWMGEFGRTPKVGDRDPTGRGHWPHCYSVLLAGGLVAGGQVYGSSDKAGAYPQDRPVTPGDLAATIFAALGLDPASTITDRVGRPYPLAEGAPLEGLWTGA